MFAKVDDNTSASLRDRKAAFFVCNDKLVWGRGLMEWRIPYEGSSKSVWLDHEGSFNV